MTKRLFIMLACAIMFAIVACGQKESGSGSPSDMDVSNPMAVAESAWEAIKSEDFDTYLALVHPDSRLRETREEWLKSIRRMKQAPGFPTNPKLVITAQEKPDRAVAATKDFRLSMGMVFKDGRWWMD